MTKPLVVLELFCGTKSMSKVFEARGHKCFTVDLDGSFSPSLCADVLTLTPESFPEEFRHPDFMHCSPPCFVGEELVLTARGHVPIKDVRVGDHVLTHLSRWKKVLSIGRKHSNDVIRLKGHGVDHIRCTSNHPFYIKEKTSWSTKRCSKSKRIIEWSNSRWEQAKTIVGKYWATPLHAEKLNVAHILPPYVIGRWLGDGWVNLERGEVHICCSHKEELELESALSATNMAWNKSRQDSVFRFTLYDRNISDFLYSNFGKGAGGKRIAGWVIGEDLAFREALFKGYMDSDGHEQKDGTLKASSVSRSLIYGIESLAKGLGFTCNIRLSPPRPKTHSIDGRTINMATSWTIGMTRTPRAKRYLTRFSDENLGFSLVKSNKKERCSAWVYDIEVEDDHSYTINNIVVHNCTTFSVASMGHHWTGGKGAYIPRTEEARIGLALMHKTTELIRLMQPKAWTIENPRGLMRKLITVPVSQRQTVCYCRYGDKRMKPTDIWTNLTTWQPRPMCHNGNPDHEAAPRGAKTGTQGLKGARERSIIPAELCNELAIAVEEMVR